MKFLLKKPSLLYWLITLTVAFILVEWIYRVFIFDKNEEPVSIPSLYVPFPYIGFKGWANTPSHFVPYAHSSRANYYDGERYEDRFNSLGYRGPVPLKKKDSSFRIFILGGSSVILGHPPITELLEEILHKEGFKKARVFNFGASASVTGQDVARILYECVDFHPDLIMMYSGWNDLLHHFYMDPRPGYISNFMVHENNPVAMGNNNSFPWALILYQSRILRSLLPDFFYERFTNREALRFQVGYNTVEWKKQIVDAYWNHIVKAKKVSEVYGADFVAVFQAVVYGKTLRINENFHGNTMEKTWDFMFNYLIESAKQTPNKSVAFFDKSGLFDSFNEQVFVDPVHIKQKYRKHVAQALFEIIIQFEALKNAQMTR